MNSEIVIADEIKNKIFTIRGIQVMLDRDLAELYSIKNIRLREQVKRNPKRFPPDMLFQLSEVEVDFMVSQNAIPSKKHLGGYLPYAFTEQGVAMLSTVLKSDRAVDVSLMIMRAFVAMRKFLIENASIFQRLDRIELKQIETDNKFEQIFEALQNKQLKPTQGIFFDGQIFDAYKFVSDIIRSAKQSITLIDNYIDENTITILSKKEANIKVLILTRTINAQLKLDIEKANGQYGNFEAKEFSKSHDRFLIIDNVEIYHLGASLKDLGKKWFAFSKMETPVLELLEKMI